MCSGAMLTVHIPGLWYIRMYMFSRCWVLYETLEVRGAPSKCQEGKLACLNYNRTLNLSHQRSNETSISVMRLDSLTLSAAPGTLSSSRPWAMSPGYISKIPNKTPCASSSLVTGGSCAGCMSAPRARVGSLRRATCHVGSTGPL